jgi:peptidyl-prolyl cis-trans isomerase-like 4
LLPGPGSKSFTPEIGKKLKHTRRGTVSMATAPSRDDPNELVAGSQFIITLRDDIQELDGKAAIFGHAVESDETLDKINNAFVDEEGRPLRDIRIRHTIVLEDPFPDPPGLVEPDKSPLPTPAQLATVRIADDEILDENEDQETLEKERKKREAAAQALTLEMVGDLPFAEVKPPENVLFVCKLNPVTQDEDLELIFSRFGKILSCEIIRDRQTGDSLQYAFIEFENQADCEKAYFRMQDVLIDDHRIHVDFSQSVSKLSDNWRDKENAKRRHEGGGFGGIQDLERRTQYRDEGNFRKNGGRYGYVFAPGEKKRPDSDFVLNRRSRSRSPRPERRDRNRDRRDDRHTDYNASRRDRSRDKYRERSRERHRDERRRDRSRERYRNDARGHDRRRR